MALMHDVHLGAIKDWAIPSASAQVAVKRLFHLSGSTFFAFAVRYREGCVACNHHPRGAEAALRPVKAGNALCTRKTPYYMTGIKF